MPRTTQRLWAPLLTAGLGTRLIQVLHPRWALRMAHLRWRGLDVAALRTAGLPETRALAGEAQVTA